MAAPNQDFDMQQMFKGMYDKAGGGTGIGNIVTQGLDLYTSDTMLKMKLKNLRTQATLRLEDMRWKARQGMYRDIGRQAAAGVEQDFDALYKDMYANQLAIAEQAEAYRQAKRAVSDARKMQMMEGVSSMIMSAMGAGGTAKKSQLSDPNEVMKDITIGSSVRQKDPWSDISLSGKAPLSNSEVAPDVTLKKPDWYNSFFGIGGNQ